MAPRRRKQSHRLRTLLLVPLLALLALVGYEAWTWPDVAALARRNPTTTAFIKRYRARQRGRRGGTTACSACSRPTQRSRRA